MPETSIIIKAQDRYSDSVKAMAQNSRAFAGDLEDLDSRLKVLTRNKYEIKMELKKAKSQLKELEKQYEATGNAADKMALEAGEQNYDTMVRNLRLVTREVGNVERQMRNTAETSRKLGNSGILGTVSEFLQETGLGKVAGNAAKKLGTAYLGSALGDSQASIVTSVLSGAAKGAAMGSGFGLPGMVIGATVSAISEGVSACSKVFEKKDDAFQSYVQESVEETLSEQQTDISGGSAIAAGRETDLVSFSTLFGNRETAETYLENLVEMANSTPFLYDDLTTMSRTLASYGYDSAEILPVLETIGNAGAALGMSTSDMNMIASALGRMKSSDKTTLEYLNILNDRGIGAVGMLADSYGIDAGSMYDRISRGDISGNEAVEILLEGLNGKFSGAMLENSRTFSGLSSTLEGMNQEMENAYGEGFNETRKLGLQEQIDFLSGENGEKMQEANRAIGAWYAGLENEKERILREEQEKVMNSEEYRLAIAEGSEESAAQAGKMLMEAKVKAQNEYNASEGALLLRESELELIQSVRQDTALREEYWNSGYVLGEEFSKGVVAGRIANFNDDVIGVFEGLWQKNEDPDKGNYYYSPYAVGIDRVPYDDFPVRLHQGERVLTAREARREDDGKKDGVRVEIGSVNFGGNFGDPKQAAEVFARELERELMLIK